MCLSVCGHISQRPSVSAEIVFYAPRRVLFAGKPPEPLWAFGAHIGSVKAIAVDGDGKLLATGGDDEYIKLFDISTKRERGELSQHTGRYI